MGNCCSNDYRVEEQGQVAYHRRNGEVQIIKGPTRIRVEKEGHVQELYQYTADQKQYLVIKHKNGKSEHKRGPCSMFLNPLEHNSISTEELINLDASEVLVVYTQVEENDSERNLVLGPQLFMPTASQWIQEFSWHGTDKNRPEFKVRDAVKFVKLRVVPDQFYHFVHEVRTSDDALLTVKLMIFFELKKVEKMLDQTHDPIAVSADIIQFASQMPYEIFLEKTALLNELESYPNLVSNAKKIGYNIGKVVYRGYHASDKLQSMHDNAISSRTQLRLESETEEQAQKLADMKLLKDIERSQKKQEMQQQEMDHANKLSRKEHEEKMFQRKQEIEAENNAKQTENEEQIKYLSELQKLDVNLTSYMVAQYTSN